MAATTTAASAVPPQLPPPPPPPPPSSGVSVAEFRVDSAAEALAAAARGQRHTEAIAAEAARRVESAALARQQTLQQEWRKNGFLEHHEENKQRKDLARAYPFLTDPIQ